MKTSWLHHWQHHAHFGTRLCSQYWSDLICINSSGIVTSADAICHWSLWNSFSGTAVFPLNEFRQFSDNWFQLHNEKRDALHRGQFALFPVDPNPRMAEVLEHQVPVVAHRSHELVENQKCPPPLTGQVHLPGLWRRYGGNRDGLTVRTLYWYVWPLKKWRNGLCWGKIKTWKYKCMRECASASISWTGAYEQIQDQS